MQHPSATGVAPSKGGVGGTLHPPLCHPESSCLSGGECICKSHSTGNRRASPCSALQPPPAAGAGSPAPARSLPIFWAAASAGRAGSPEPRPICRSRTDRPSRKAAWFQKMGVRGSSPAGKLSFHTFFSLLLSSCYFSALPLVALMIRGQRLGGPRRSTPGEHLA